MGHILHNHIYLFDMFLSLAWSLYIYTVFISSLSSNFSCPPDDERASILRAILYHVLCSSIRTSLKNFLLILHASVLVTDRSTQGTKRWVKFQWLEWSSRVSMYAGGWQLQVLQNEVIDGPAMLLLKIPQAELSSATGYPQTNPACVLR